MNNSLKIYFTLICAWFAIASHAQAVRVIDNKGTIKIINNNKVTTATTAPASPVVGDVWFDNSIPAQVLTKIWDGTSWVIDSIKGIAGSVFFAGTNTFPTENNAQLFWDNTNNRLGIGLISPLESLHIANNMRLNGSLVDSSGDKGNLGQILSATATGTDWVEPFTLTVIPVTADYTLSATDVGKVLDVTSNTPITITVPTGLTPGFQVSITQAGAGQVTFVGSGGMAVRNRWNGTKTTGQWAKAGIEIRATNSAVLSGDVL